MKNCEHSNEQSSIIYISRAAAVARKDCRDCGQILSYSKDEIVPLFSHGGDSKMNYPRKFVKRPVEVEAMCLEGTAGDCHRVYSWMENNGYLQLFGNALNPEELYDPDLGNEVRPTKGVWIDPGTGDFMIRTLEGDMRVKYGDWVIRGVAGEFYPCKPDIFNQTYKLSENHD